MLVLDSNTISYYFRGDAQVVPRMQALPPADLGVPAIVEYELRYGLLRLAPEAAEPRLAALAQLLRPMQLLPFDSECAAHAARIRAELDEATRLRAEAEAMMRRSGIRWLSTTTKSIEEIATTILQEVRPERLMY